jgi:hypothetical protein
MPTARRPSSRGRQSESAGGAGDRAGSSPAAARVATATPQRRDEAADRQPGERRDDIGDRGQRWGANQKRATAHERLTRSVGEASIGWERPARASSRRPSGTTPATPATYPRRGRARPDGPSANRTSVAKTVAPAPLRLRRAGARRWRRVPGLAPRAQAEEVGPHRRPSGADPDRCRRGGRASGESRIRPAARAFRRSERLDAPRDCRPSRRRGGSANDPARAICSGTGRDAPGVEGARPGISTSRIRHRVEQPARRPTRGPRRRRSPRGARTACARRPGSRTLPSGRTGDGRGIAPPCRLQGQARGEGMTRPGRAPAAAPPHRERLRERGRRGHAGCCWVVGGPTTPMPGSPVERR